MSSRQQHQGQWANYRKKKVSRSQTLASLCPITGLGDKMCPSAGRFLLSDPVQGRQPLSLCSDFLLKPQAWAATLRPPVRRGEAQFKGASHFHRLERRQKSSLPILGTTCAQLQIAISPPCSCSLQPHLNSSDLGSPECPPEVFICHGIDSANFVPLKICQVQT